jgi:toxin ParE1/3/4
MKADRKLRLTADARADVRSILRYTARQWGVSQRDIYHAQLYEGMDRLHRHPELGEESSDLFDGCRVWRVDNHLLFYRIAKLVS